MNHSRASRPLSARQVEIADLVKSGMTSRQIGEALRIDPRTVESHIEAICNKLGVRTRVELVVALFGSGDDANARSERATRTNIPLTRTSLIGRETQVADIVSMLEDSHLVTVTGAGGVGKTRTACAAGEVLLGRRKSGVWLVELASLTRGSFVTAAVAKVLNIRESTRRPLLQTLLASLRFKELVLIFDNCEHVVGDAADLAAELLLSCPNVRILSTSREPLRVAGEATYRLPSLRVPTSPETLHLTVAGAVGYSAVRLFAQRAQDIERGFALNAETAPIAAEICRRLDGIPLAIELAAARVKSVPVRTLQAMLDERFTMLKSGARKALPRHRTMQAAIDWSYDLLSPSEQRVFERLSIFAGGCDRLAAEAVCSDDADPAGLPAILSSLVDKSLVSADGAEEEPRYRLFESTREYGRKKLTARGEEHVVARRHALAYTDLAERLDDAYERAPNLAWFAGVEPDLDNWRTALDWTLGARGDIQLGQRLASALAHIWRHFSLIEGRRWLRVALELVDERTPPTVIANLELVSAAIAFEFEAVDAALAGSLRAIERYRAASDRSARFAAALRLAGTALVALGRIAEAQPLLQSALETARAAGSQRLTGVVLQSIAIARSKSGDVAAARAYFAEALEIFEKIDAQYYAANVAGALAEAEFRAGNVARSVQLMTTLIGAMRDLRYALFTAIGVCNLAAYLIACDRWDEARRRARESLDLAQQMQLAALIAYALQRLAAIAALTAPNLAADLSGAAPLADDLSGAARLLGYVDACLEELGAPRAYTEQQEYDRVLELLRERFGSAELAELMAGGAMMTQDEAVEAGRRI